MYPKEEVRSPRTQDHTRWSPAVGFPPHPVKTSKSSGLEGLTWSREENPQGPAESRFFLCWHVTKNDQFELKQYLKIFSPETGGIKQFESWSVVTWSAASPGYSCYQSASHAAKRPGPKGSKYEEPLCLDLYWCLSNDVNIPILVENDWWRSSCPM